MNHRKKAMQDAYMLIGIPKISKMKPFRWDKKKHPRWARKGRKV